MAFDIKPIDPATRAFFAGVVSGIDLTRRLSDEEVAAIHAGMDRFGMLVFHSQKLDDESQLAFSRQLGPLETATGDIAAPEDRRIGMDLNDISNLDKHGKVVARDDRRRLFGLGNQLWHSDSSFKEVPAKYSLLSARQIPPSGGNTEFADMRAAYDALDAATRAEVEDLVCEHSLIYSRQQLGFAEFLPDERVSMKPVLQRLVRTHPVTGRKSLYLSAHIGTIIGWPRPEAMAFARDLMEHATQPEFVYVHRWTKHDLVMWDNRTTMHRVRRFDDLAIVRDMRRTTTRSDGPTMAQQAA